jgi:hypothetical protein
VRERTGDDRHRRNVKQPAVKHGVELLSKIGQLEGIPDEEPRIETTVAGFALREIDRAWDGIDACSV